MSVLVECYSVIVRRSEIEQRYPGGLARYERECPGRTFCADSHLVRVGFMTTRDLEMFLLRNLSRTDLASSPTGNGRDRRISCQSVAIVEQWRGRWHPDKADWLEYAQRPDGVCHSWLEGTPPGDLCVPHGWFLGDDYSRSFVKLPPWFKGTPVPPGEIEEPPARRARLRAAVPGFGPRGGRAGRW